MTSAPDEVQCPCCQLFYPRRNPDRFAARTVAIDPRTGVCWDCDNHQGESDAVIFARKRHHGSMLRREYAELRKQLAAARQEVVEMERELAMRPTQVRVRVENLDKIIVDEAKKEQDDAYRRRDVAMGALSDVRLLHHKRRDDKTRCECGALYAKCEMAQIVDRWEGVVLWEQSQAGRAYRGERHALRRDHPALTDRTYIEDVYGA